MRIGVVGLGFWGSKHVRVLSGLGEVHRVVGIDPDESRRDTMEEAFPHILTRPSLEAALDTVDAVVIATKPSTHAPLAMQAIRAGKHVMVEKPLATTSGDAQGLVAAAHRQGVVLMVGHTFEYNPAVIELREIIRSGHLGKMLYLDSSRLNLGLYQSDVDVIWDLAPHDVSILNMVLDAEPTAASAWGTGHIHDGLVDNAYLRLDYDTVQTQATIHVSWLQPRKVRRLTAVGSQRMAVYDDMADDDQIRIYDKGVQTELADAPHERPLSYRYGEIVSPYIPMGEPLKLEGQHFVRCVEGHEDVRSDGERGLAVVRALEAAERSLRVGRTVAIGTPSRDDVARRVGDPASVV
jgi:predicted dehydrogenase